MNSYKREVYGKMIKVIANALVLAAVAVSMYQAYAFPDSFLAVFCQWFFAMLVGILIFCWLSLCAVARRFPIDAQTDLRQLSVVDLPRRGPQLVRWDVLYSPSQRRREASEALLS